MFDRRAVIVDGPHRTADVLPPPPAPGEILFCAPRPLVGDKTWQGDFIVGSFYALVWAKPDAERQPWDRRRAWAIKENHGLDATVLRLLTEAEAKAEIEAYYAADAKLAGYLERYRAGGLWDVLWYDRWFHRLAWDTVEVRR